MGSPRVSNIVNEPKLIRLGTIRLGIKKDGKITEIEHFVLDIEDQDIKEKAITIYGKKPKELDITFFTDNMSEVFQCKYQRWGKSKKGTSYLICEGNGDEAYDSEGNPQNCPCSFLGKECKKTTVLKFLIPRASMGGYFILSTRSEHNARVFETTLNLVLKATGGLTMQMLKMKRTEGYSTVNGIKTKKYYVSLVWDKGLDEIETLTNGSRSLIAYSEPIEPIDDPQQENADIPEQSSIQTPSSDDSDRVQHGRRKVIEKLNQHVKGPYSEEALKLYACQRYSVISFDYLSVDELLELWHGLDKDYGMVHEIYRISVQLKDKRNKA